MANYELAIDIPQHLYSCDTSLLFAKNGSEAQLLIHVPVVKSRGPLILHQFNNFPMRAKKLYHQLQIEPTRVILRINNERSHYVELSVADLTSCERVNSHYVCPHLQTLSIVDKCPSCLTALYFSNFNNMLKYCPIKD